MDDTLTLAEALDELVSAEDFLDYFAVPYDASVVQVNRLHILQRFHDYLTKQAPVLPPEESAQRAIYRQCPARAYQDFVRLDAQTETRATLCDGRCHAIAARWQALDCRECLWLESNRC